MQIGYLVPPFELNCIRHEFTHVPGAKGVAGRYFLKLKFPSQFGAELLLQTDYALRTILKNVGKSGD